MPKRCFLVLFAFVFFLTGCQAASPKQAKRDDAQSAVGSVVSGVSGKGIRAQYCPVCGKHYGSKVATCPIDGVKLEEIKE